MMDDAQPRTAVREEVPQRVLGRTGERVSANDGASRWGIFRDTEAPDRYLETFLVNSWAEHLRQHERQTQADRALEGRLYSCVRGEPKVRHLIYAQTD